MEQADLINLVGTIGSLIIFSIAAAQILHRTGYSRWRVLLLFVPFVNVIALFIFAFNKWPIDELNESKKAQWSEAENKAFKAMLDKRQ